MKPSSHIDYLVSLIFTATRLIRERAEQKERIDPFSFLRLGTLHYVEKNANPTMRDIAKHLCVSPPSATSLINGMVKSQFLSRLDSKDDRRIVRLALTAKGKKALKAGFLRVNRRMESVLKNLNAEDQKHLTKILEKLVNVYSI